MNPRIRRYLFSLVFFACLASVSTRAAALPPELFNGLSWRSVGPFRGGRAVSVAGVPGNGRTVYFGSVGGGIWTTSDAGTVWTPVFDGQKIASIGAIAVANSAPDIVYAGSGEADMRSDIGFGDGMYKSIDAGRTWTHIGLDGTMQIGRIVVDPGNPDIVYVAALGHAYGANAERGVYRSKDGGASWTKVLDKGPDVGAVDLAMAMDNPRVLYAAMWHARRTPWSQYPPRGGAGSGLYKSTDGGDTWTELTGHGLPDGELGRIGVAVAGGDLGKTVYALIECKKSGLYRSSDAGVTWALVGTDPRIDSRAWYFSTLTVDPSNPDVVYIPNVALMRTQDGGKTFDIVRGAPGGDDYHQIWVDPADSAHLALATDQGTSISLDRGKTWSTWYNQPTAQFYHIAADNKFPYAIYGAQQDSGTPAVPSRTDPGEIGPRDWFPAGGSESGYIAPDPLHPDLFYVGGTYGGIVRHDMRTSQSQNIGPWPVFSFGTDISQHKYRFTWTSPLVFSPAAPDTLYYGAQVLLMTRDGGTSWREISPDLTGDTRKKGAPPEKGEPEIANARERGYGVIYTVAPSRLDANVIWTGSDTGLVYITRDGGKSWHDVTPPGVAAWSKITLIEASHFHAGEAYAAIDRHRLDDYAPYFYRTRDFGKTWTAVIDGLAAPAYLNAIREDPKRAGLLFAGTELGVAVSFDDGDHWQSLQLNLPTVSVRDLVIHDGDLAIATHGRAFWILDDIAPLRQANAEIAAKSAWLYAPAPAIRMNPEKFSGTPLPPEEPAAKNPADGASIDYYLAAAPAEAVKLEILDANGKTIRRFSSGAKPPSRRTGLSIADRWLTPPPGLTAKPGMNRFTWDLRYPSPGEAEDEEAEFSGFGGGPQVFPGTYRARLTVDGKPMTQPFQVKLDPRSKATAADLEAQLALGLKASAKMRESAATLRAVKAAPASPEREALLHGDESLAAVNSELVAVLGVVESADRKPTLQSQALFEDASKKLTAAQTRAKALK